MHISEDLVNHSMFRKVEMEGMKKINEKFNN
jgi:hypothetical protein